jgi:hypothetical protein
MAHPDTTPDDDDAHEPVVDGGWILGRDPHPGFSPATWARIDRRFIAWLEKRYPGYRFHVSLPGDEDYPTTEASDAP